MQQIKLTEFDESYAVSIKDALPEYGMGVFIKLNSGVSFKAEFFTSQLYEPHFDNLNGKIIKPEAVSKWHPVTVDL